MGRLFPLVLISTRYHHDEVAKVQQHGAQLHEKRHRHRHRTTSHRLLGDVSRRFRSPCRWRVTQNRLKISVKRRYEANWWSPWASATPVMTWAFCSNEKPVGEVRALLQVRSQWARVFLSLYTDDTDTAAPIVATVVYTTASSVCKNPAEVMESTTVVDSSQLEPKWGIKNSQITSVKNR